MPGACCPGRSEVRMLAVGGQKVGLSHLDEIMRAAMGLQPRTDEETKEFLLKQLKIYNYIPSGAEGDYLEAVWEEYLRFRSSGDVRR